MLLRINCEDIYSLCGDKSSQEMAMYQIRLLNVSNAVLRLSELGVVTEGEGIEIWRVEIENLTQIKVGKSVFSVKGEEYNEK